MKERDSLLLDALIGNLLKVIEQHKQTPHLPHWGELFVIVHDIQRLLKYAEEDIVLYPIHPTGELIYDHTKRIFVAKTPNFNVNMEPDNFIDALLSDRLRPRKTEDGRIWRRQ
jgi:hypothetical protein